MGDRELLGIESTLPSSDVRRFKISTSVLSFLETENLAGKVSWAPYFQQLPKTKSFETQFSKHLLCWLRFSVVAILLHSLAETTFRSLFVTPLLSRPTGITGLQSSCQSWNSTHNDIWISAISLDVAERGCILW